MANVETFAEFIAEQQLDEAGPRIKRIKVRFRGGVIQRNVRVNNVHGFFKLKGRGSNARLVRMSSTERMHRRRGARRAKFKRRAKASRIRMKRMRTMRRRHAMGL